MLLYEQGVLDMNSENSRYSELITYLKGTESPDINTCITYIAKAGYGGTDSAAYIKKVKDWVYTLEKRSNIG